MKTIEQIQEQLRVVEQQRKYAEDHAQGEIGLVRTGQEMALLWVLDREADIAARLGMAEGDIDEIKKHATRFAGLELPR